MRLSEAILLGSTMITCGSVNPRNIGDNTSGCGLEMALVAVGRRDLAWAQAWKIWGWLDPDCGTLGLVDTQDFRIATRFDALVLHGDMTIEEFCSWVDRIDPTPRDSQESVETTQEVNNTEKVRA